jgi:hypothetical protein
VRRRVDRIETSLLVAGVEPAEREMVAELEEPVTFELGAVVVDPEPRRPAAGTADNGSAADHPATPVRSN